MPERVLQPRPIVWIQYGFLVAAGAFFEFSAEAESIRIVLGHLGSHLTSLMLFVGGLVGVIGSVTHRYGFELSAYPFLVAPWAVYAIVLFVRAAEGNGLIGFACLLGAGTTGLVGRSSELWRTIQIHRDFRRRQSERAHEHDEEPAS